MLMSFALGASLRGIAPEMEKVPTLLQKNVYLEKHYSFPKEIYPQFGGIVKISAYLSMSLSARFR